MKWLSAGLTFVNAATLFALLLGLILGGLGRGSATFSFTVAGAVAALAYLHTRRAEADAFAVPDSSAEIRWGRVVFWSLASIFAFFALRSFCWLIFADGNQLKVQSVNNLGDLALHLTYINTFASGVPLWPDNPIHAFSKMRYPAGTDMFNGLLVLLGFDLVRGLIWAGLIGSLASFYALCKWGGAFGVAGFLFNGGLAGFQLLETWQLRDFQGGSDIAWKSLPLSMLVTQRGLLYALPAGLLLLYQWRARFSQGAAASQPPMAQEHGGSETAAPWTAPLPFWLELSLYATMPLFHLHTFMALSIVAAFLFALGDTRTRKQLGLMVGIAVLPATFLVYTITDRFRASSLLQWQPGWVQNAGGDLAAPFFRFWLVNFGILIPLVLLLVGWCIWRACKAPEKFSFKAHPSFAFLAPAAFIFLFACLVKTAPWEWDNIKLIIWAYVIMLPFLWTELIARWPWPVRAGVCFALFASGFISLFGGLVRGENGYGVADRAEMEAVALAARKLPLEARFATYPTYNHPLLLVGRKVVLGYPGHLWTQGFDYNKDLDELNALMLGAEEWREHARALQARYLFWGAEEKRNYAASLRPWETEAPVVASGEWGSIYDLQAAPPVPGPRQ